MPLSGYHKYAKKLNVLCLREKAEEDSFMSCFWTGGGSLAIWFQLETKLKYWNLLREKGEKMRETELVIKVWGVTERSVF